MRSGSDTPMFHYVLGLFKAVGPFKAIVILCLRLLRIEREVAVCVEGNRLMVRPCDSDLAVMSQVFGFHEYAIDAGRLARLRAAAVRMRQNGFVPLIIDAGANIGYSALFFHRLFPDAAILAVEPGAKSFALLARHVLPYPAITPIHAALWSHERGLSFSVDAHASWGGAVTEGVGTPSIRMDTLVASVPNAQVLLIKMDIEGAEKEVVASCPTVFADARCLLVEPHDYDRPGLGCLQPLYRAVGERRFDTVISGENLAFFAADL